MGLTGSSFILRFISHSLDRKPGLSLGPFGQWFTRNETWAEQAQPWVSYLTRSCYLLQPGHFAADIVYFYGEDSNLTALFLHKAPEIPAGTTSTTSTPMP